MSSEGEREGLREDNRRKMSKIKYKHIWNCQGIIHNKLRKRERKRESQEQSTIIMILY